MRRLNPQKLLLNRQKGFSLVEMLVALSIVSILAVISLPYAQITVRRTKEIELKNALRQMRTAISEFHQDVEEGVIKKDAAGVSKDGFPETLSLLVEGVDSGEADGKKVKYLRRIPKDPFQDPKIQPLEHWVLRSYRDEADSITWGTQDVYDVRSSSNKKALDGSYYKDW